MQYGALYLAINYTLKLSLSVQPLANSFLRILYSLLSFDRSPIIKLFHDLQYHTHHPPVLGHLTACHPSE
jgi:hypothetical protein